MCCETVPKVRTGPWVANNWSTMSCSGTRLYFWKARSAARCIDQDSFEMIPRIRRKKMRIENKQQEEQRD